MRGAPPRSAGSPRWRPADRHRHKRFQPARKKPPPTRPHRRSRPRPATCNPEPRAARPPRPIRKPSRRSNGRKRRTNEAGLNLRIASRRGKIPGPRAIRKWFLSGIIIPFLFLNDFHTQPIRFRRPETGSIAKVAMMSPCAVAKENSIDLSVSAVTLVTVQS